MLQARGAGIAASVPDADAVARRDPRCCQADYLDQPITRTPSTSSSTTARSCRSVTPSGRSSALPGHAPGHLCLWQPDEWLLIAGDALSDDDVGWVNTALDGPDAAATALACRELCLMENRAEPEHLRAGSTPWQSAVQTQIVGDLRAFGTGGRTSAHHA